MTVLKCNEIIITGHFRFYLLYSITNKIINNKFTKVGIKYNQLNKNAKGHCKSFMQVLYSIEKKCAVKLGCKDGLI